MRAVAGTQPVGGPREGGLLRRAGDPGRGRSFEERGRGRASRGRGRASAPGLARNSGRKDARPLCARRPPRGPRACDRLSRRRDSVRSPQGAQTALSRVFPAWERTLLSARLGEAGRALSGGTGGVFQGEIGTGLCWGSSSRAGHVCPQMPQSPWTQSCCLPVTFPAPNEAPPSPSSASRLSIVCIWAGAGYRWPLRVADFVPRIRSRAIERVCIRLGAF